MPHQFSPRVGDWYRDEIGQVFEVVAIDEGDNSIEVQYFDGDLAEFDTDTWYDLTLEPQEQSEDWSGPFDDLEADDFGDTERIRHDEDWSEIFDQ